MSRDDPPESVGELFRLAGLQLDWAVLSLEDRQHAVSFSSRALAQRLAPGSVIALLTAEGKEYYALLPKSAVKTVGGSFKLCILGEAEHASRQPQAKSPITHKTADWFHKKLPEGAPRLRCDARRRVRVAFRVHQQVGAAAHASRRPPRHLHRSKSIGRKRWRWDNSL